MQVLANIAAQLLREKWSTVEADAATVPPPPLYKLRLRRGACRWTFHRSWISYA